MTGFPAFLFGALLSGSVSQNADRVSGCSCYNTTVSDETANKPIRNGESFNETTARRTPDAVRGRESQNNFQSSDPPSLYRSVLGSRLDLLPEPMRSFHDSTLNRQATGDFAVERSSGFRGLVARILGFPKSGVDVPLRLEVTVIGSCELWSRQFQDQLLITSQWKHGELLIEASGPVRLGLELREDDTGLTYRYRKWWFWRIPMPHWLAPGIRVETAPRQHGWFVDVRIALPVIGQMVRYAGEIVADSGNSELVEPDG